MTAYATAYWALIHSAITLFRYTPLFYIGGIATQYFLHGPSSWTYITTKILCFLLAAEALFYFVLWRPYQTRLALPSYYPEESLPSSRAERKALLDECLAHISDPASYLQWWFLGSDLEDIRRENLREFILWAFFDRENMTPEECRWMPDEIDEYISVFESRLGKQIPDGRGPATSLRLNFDEVNTAYRGLAWYTIIFLVDQITSLAMRLRGFEYYASPGESVFPPRPQHLFAANQSPAADLGYWFRPHLAGPDKLPVAFFHGIGVGLWTYLSLLFGIIYDSDAKSDTQVGVIAVEMLHVSFRLTPTPPLEPSEFVRQMTKILHYHHWDQFAIVSHSYGSVATAHILRSPELRHRVPSVVLMDPVTIMLHLPWVAYNFTRRVPNAANEWMLWYFASKDPCVAHSLGRHFFWRHNIIWKDQLLAYRSPEGHTVTRRVAVCLSGQDIIVDAPAIAKYLKGSTGMSASTDDAGRSIEVLYFPELDHAQIFNTRKQLQRAISLVRSYCVA